MEKYSWFFLDLSSTWAHISLLSTLLVIALSTVLFITYGYLSNDPTPDSFVGYTYAIVGTLFMLLAALSYSLYRRSRNRIRLERYVEKSEEDEQLSLSVTAIPCDILYHAMLSIANLSQSIAFINLYLYAYIR